MANFHVDSSGNLWLGDTSTTFTTSAPFYVTSAGVVKATSGTFGGITVDSSGIEANYSAGTSGFRIESDGDAFFNKVDIRIGGAASQNPNTGFTTLDIGSAKLSEYNDDLWVNAERVLIYDSDGNASANSPSLFLFATYGQPGWYVDDSQVNRTKLYYSNGVNNVFHTESDNTYLHLDGSGIQVGTATGGNSQYIGKNSSGSFGWHTLPSGNDHPDGDHSFAALSHNHDGDYVDTVSGSTDALTISGRNITLNFGNTGTRVAAGNHNHDGDYSTGAHLQLISSGGTNGTATTAARSNHDHGLSTHTHTSVLSFSANQINIYGAVKPSSNNSRTIGTSSSLRFADMYSQEFYGQYFYGTLINSSSENVKTNIADTGLGLDFIEALPIKQFNYITDGHSDKKYTGVIAEDVQDILDANDWDDYYLVVDNSDTYRFNNRCQHPAICTCENEDCEEGNMSCQDDCCSSYFKYTEEDGTVTNWIHHTVAECEAFEVDGNRHPHFNYYQLVGPLVKAVQELSTQVSDLTARIETLEG